MRSRLTLLMTVALVASALATDTGNRMPAKSSPAVPPNIPDPATIRQGGDTIADAVVIPELPFEITGTTAGYTDDYDEVCPYDGSTSPDVVYSFTPQTRMIIDIDLCGSSYDTKLYLYDHALGLVACNDDFYYDEECGFYVSKLESVGLVPYRSYYVIIDGYGGDFGEYLMEITETEYEPCAVICSPVAMLEGEPPLVDDYDDNYNCGCNCVPRVFQDIPGDAYGHRFFCGVSGWYLHDGDHYRDTDWFHLALPANGTVTLEIEAEMPTYVFQLDLHCSLGVLQIILADPCVPTTMTFTAGDVPQTVRIAVMSTNLEAPPGFFGNEFVYELRLSGLEPMPVAVETASWSAVKGLFR